MTRFRFCMIGTSQQPVIEMPVGSLTELHELMDRSRFVEGRMVEVDGDGVQLGVLVASSRVQMVVEAD